MEQIPGSHFEFDSSITTILADVDGRVSEMRADGRLDGSALHRISQHFRLKTIYNSNAIEGNQLDYGETRMVVEQGLTISGKPLRDTLEAKNLAQALDLFEQLATRGDIPITERDIRQVHQAILSGIDDANAGAYRLIEVEISGSQFKPTAPESVPPEMRDFAAWLSRTMADPAVPAVVVAAAAHAWFAQIHPFVDGNGRTGRILMNLVLMRRGYPIAVITKDDRQRYYDALEVSQVGDLTPFLTLIVESVEEALAEWESAAEERAAEREDIQGWAALLNRPALDRQARDYEVFRAAMELLRTQFEQVILELDERAARPTRLFFKHFSMLELDKYQALANRSPVKRTWFFRVDFRVDTLQGERTARYLFWFGRPHHTWPHGERRPEVTLVISKEDPADTFYYVTLDALDETGRRDIPDLREISFDPKEERYIGRNQNGTLQQMQVDDIVRTFVDQVIQRNFSNL